MPAGGSDTRGALDVITVETYDVFELAWEWKIAPGGNSGLKYFVLEDRDAAIGHEYQMLDDEQPSRMRRSVRIARRQRSTTSCRPMAGRSNPPAHSTRAASSSTERVWSTG